MFESSSNSSVVLPVVLLCFFIVTRDQEKFISLSTHTHTHLQTRVFFGAFEQTEKLSCEKAVYKIVYVHNIMES